MTVGARQEAAAPAPPVATLLGSRTSQPWFTLIVATLNRVDELDALLASLAAQRYRRFDVLVVDQNSDNRLGPVLDRYRRTLTIQRFRAMPGLSRARNLGVSHARGEILAFPDDDCVYPPGLLESVAAAFAADRKADGISILPRSREGEPFPRFDRTAGPLRRFNVFRRCSSIGLFLRQDVFQRVGCFNESLGLGAGTLWGAGEDVDLPLRALDAGLRMEYLPDIGVLHRVGVTVGGAAAARRGYSYGAGLGWLIRRHRYPAIFSLHHLIVRPFGAMLIALFRLRWPEVRFYAAALRGRVRGWLEA